MRRSRLVPILSALILIAAAVSASDVPDLRSRRTGDDWPRFLGPSADGKSAETGLVLDWPEQGPPLAWHRKVGEGYSTVSTSNGRLFFFDSIPAKGESKGQLARLTCLNAETGEQLWRREDPYQYEDYYGYSVGPKAAATVDGERVFTFGITGDLRARRVTDGEELWRVDTAADFGVVQNFFGVGASPVVEGDALIVVVGGSPKESPKIHTGEVKGNGSGLVAFDKRTGEVRWRLSDELAAYATPRIVDLEVGRRGFAFTRGGLLAFDPARGEEKFFFPWRSGKIESVNAATPVVVGVAPPSSTELPISMTKTSTLLRILIAIAAVLLSHSDGGRGAAHGDKTLGDTVFVTESYGPGGALLRLAPKSPEGYEVVWKDPPRGKAMASHWSTPIHHEGYLYGSSGESSGEATLNCVDYATGEVKWSEPGLRRSTLLYVDGHFIVLAEYGELLVIRATPERFDVVSRIDLGDKNAPGAKDSVSAEDDGRPVLRFPAWNAPVISHGYLYVRGRDRLIAFDLLPKAAASETPASKTPASKASGAP